ncbi:MAG: hypothetical protein ACYTG0_39485 [Planctomycetota bacterium]|jgi:hypothetical protein
MRCVEYERSPELSAIPQAMKAGEEIVVWSGKLGPSEQYYLDPSDSTRGNDGGEDVEVCERLETDIEAFTAGVYGSSEKICNTASEE